MVLKHAKCDSNGVKIAIFAAKFQKSPSNWAPSVTRWSSNGLFSTGPKLDNFCAKNIYFWFKPPLSYLTKPWLRFWSHSLLKTYFSSDYTGRMRNELINAAGLLRIFFQRWIQNCSFKISVFMRKSFVHFRLGSSHFVWSGDGTAGSVWLSHSQSIYWNYGLKI